MKGMTNWWEIGAVLFSGIISAIATIIAVVYSNKKTKEQLIAQEEKFSEEQKEQNKLRKMVIVKPSHQLISFTQLLDRLIVSNDYNRVLLFSGEDGFDFFDDPSKREKQMQRILSIQNPGTNEIHNVRLITSSELINTNTNAKLSYTTENQTPLLRSNESIIIRLLNQKQFETIIDLNQQHIGTDLHFSCIIEYDTLGDQRIRYLYQLCIRDDKRIEVLEDGIESVIDIDKQVLTQRKQSIFRNLQDQISSLDRSKYSWEKMGYAQATGLLQLLQPSTLQQNDGKKQEESNR